MSESRSEIIRLVLVDDHPLIREGLRLVISHQPWLELVGEAARRDEALEVVTRQQPDLVLLDLLLADCHGLELLPELRRAARQTRVLILTASRDRQQHCAALRLGAMGVVLKDQEIETLLRAVERVCADEAWLDHSLMDLLLREDTDSGRLADSEARRIALLTEREREVIALVGGGLRNKRIADQLCISEVTVRHHLTSIFNKLQIRDRLELAIYAWRNGLAVLPEASGARGNRQALSQTSRAEHMAQMIHYDWSPGAGTKNQKMV
ncbi:MAG TPA: response regulator transcription factor [Blastocatellia bacterium]|nr:response regulator transcription factor [Blastocatellia bacterium]